MFAKDSSSTIFLEVKTAFSRLAVSHSQDKAYQWPRLMTCWLSFNEADITFTGFCRHSSDTVLCYFDIHDKMKIHFKNNLKWCICFNIFQLYSRLHWTYCRGIKFNIIWTLRLKVQRSFQKKTWFDPFFKNIVEFIFNFSYFKFIWTISLIHIS